WLQSLSGKTTAHQKKTVFFRKSHAYHLTIAGNGTGNVKVTTKGAGGEQVTNAPTATTLVGADTTTYDLQVFEWQTYSIKYAPDKSADHPTASVSVSSVVSNTVPGLSTIKPQTVAFMA